MSGSLSPVSSPTLYFRLDPGEPGVLRSSPASESTYLVFAQETRNLTRLTARAAQEGQKVIFADVSLAFSQVGNRVVATSGHTKVVTVEDEGAAGTGQPANEMGSQAPPLQEAPAEAALQAEEEPAGADSAKAEDGAAASASSADSATELRNAERAVQAMKAGVARLEADMQAIEREAAGETAGRKEAYLGQRLRELNAEIRKVEFRLMARKMLRDGSTYIRLSSVANLITYFTPTPPSAMAVDREA